jgi:hypothetical protein
MFNDVEFSKVIQAKELKDTKTSTTMEQLSLTKGGVDNAMTVWCREDMIKGRCGSSPWPIILPTWVDCAHIGERHSTKVEAEGYSETQK